MLSATRFTVLLLSMLFHVGVPIVLAAEVASHVQTPVLNPSTRTTDQEVKRSYDSTVSLLAASAIGSAQAQKDLDWSALGQAALEVPKVPVQLSTEGRPGEVRLVVMTTILTQRLLPIVPRVPIYPLPTWRRWLKEHPVMSHCALDWMDAQGRWWHTEIRGYDHHPAEYRVGEGELPASGVTVYGVWILPGRSNLENNELVMEEVVACDYRVIEREARRYGRKDKRSGEPGTGGNGKYNVGLGGPAFKPTQNSNTFVAYLLHQAGVRRSAPPLAIGWDTEPHFPYSSDADAYSK